MWHSRRSYFTGNRALFEMVQSNITPQVTVKINNNGVKSRYIIKELGNIVVRLNLGGIWIPSNA